MICTILINVSFQFYTYVIYDTLYHSKVTFTCVFTSRRMFVFFPYLNRVVIKLMNAIAQLKLEIWCFVIFVTRCIPVPRSTNTLCRRKSAEYANYRKISIQRARKRALETPKQTFASLWVVQKDGPRTDASAPRSMSQSLVLMWKFAPPFALGLCLYDQLLLWTVGREIYFWSIITIFSFFFCSFQWMS